MNQNAFLKIFLLLCISIFTIQTSDAWLGLVAENWDLLSLAKWNQMISDKLSRSDLVAGNNITLTASGSEIIVNATGWWGGGWAWEPYISNSTVIDYAKSETKNITLSGYNFTSTSVVSSPAWIVNSTTHVSPVELQFNMTSGTTSGTYNILVSNGGTTNTAWTNNGVWLITVSSSTLYASCNEILVAGDSIGDGNYTLTRVGGTYQAYCDMTSDGWGWTRIVRTNNSDQEWGQKDDNYVYAGNTADTGIYDAYRYVSSFSKTMLKHIESSTFASYDLTSTSSDSVYDIMAFCKAQGVQQSNDTAWDGARIKGMTSTQSGLKVGGTMANVWFFFFCWVNEENDNDQSYLTFARSSGQTGNGYGDGWRGCTQVSTTWSLLNGDYYQATNFHIWNNYGTCSAWRKADGAAGYYEVYVK